MVAPAVYHIHSMKVAPAVSEYMDYSTVHGLGRLKNSPFLVFKLIWLLCVCGSLAMIILQINGLYGKYMSQPISTTIAVENPTTTDFPVVTVCNTNPLNYFAIETDTLLDVILQDNAKKYEIDISSLLETNDSVQAQRNVSSKPIDADILHHAADTFKMAMNYYDTETLQNLTQKFTEFMLLCTYNGAKCSEESIQMVRTYEYGICYSIFPEYQNLGKRQVSASGKRYGLELLLNVDEVQGLPFVTETSSVYVMAHKGEYSAESLYLSGGVILPTGFEADVIISQKAESLVPGGDAEPRCNDSPETYEYCLHSCQQKYIASVCNCLQYYHDFYDQSNDTIPCFDAKDYECINDVLSAFAESVPEACTSCRAPCQQLAYKTSVSLASWPSKNFVPVLNRIMTSALGSEYDISDDDDVISNNLVRVSVYLGSMSYQSIVEEYSYSTVSLFSDIGGTLGLWAGFSILSLMEIFELIFLLGLKKRQPAENSVRQVTEFEGGGEGEGKQ